MSVTHLMTTAPRRDAGLERLLGSEDSLRGVRAFVRRAAAVDAPVLITGETGTGKGLVARAIHELSARASRRFVAVNCAGVPEGLFESAFLGHARGAFTGAQQQHAGYFEQADGGTLFLDEIAEMGPPLQAKLLTSVEDGELRRLGSERLVRFDARLLAATAADLGRAVREGRFRPDLYHRLLVLSLRLPPLRERADDVLVLAEHFLRRFGLRYQQPARGFETAALRRLREHTWPGNVRELAHAIEAAVLACDVARIRLRDLPEHVLRPRTAVSPVREPAPDAGDAGSAMPGARSRYSFFGSPGAERDAILDALRRCRGNRTRAAARLGMSRNTLRQKLLTLGIDSPTTGPAHASERAEPDSDSGAAVD
ncbi:MAG: sigma-54 interaction domain-containing protein [Longimicrobiales bacterium]